LLISYLSKISALCWLMSKILIPLFHMLGQVNFICFRQEGKSSPCYSKLPGNGSSPFYNMAFKKSILMITFPISCFSLSIYLS
jgi:hypothetical protein